MQKITYPINPTFTGAEVTNLQEALLLFISKNIFKTYQPPNIPSDQDISQWTKLLNDEKANSSFGEGTRQLVLHFQIQQGLGDNLAGAVEEKTAAKINELLVKFGVIDDPESIFLVKGTIAQTNGKLYPNALVRAYDCDLRRSEPLGETTTNEIGYYEIKYGPGKLTNAEKGSADIMVRVFEKVSASEERHLGASEIFFNAKPVQEINLVLQSLPTEKIRSEWEIMNELVLPLLRLQKPKMVAIEYDDLPPAELTAEDFDFINKETGLDQNNLRLWSMAYGRNIEESRIPPQVFYGWFRMGLPTEFKGLWTLTIDQLNNALIDAANKNIIPELSPELRKILEVLGKILFEFILLPATDGAKAGIGDIINIVIGSNTGRDFTDDKKKAVIDIASQLDPDAEKDFQEKMNGIKNITPGEITVLQKAFRLDKITLSNRPLMKSLHEFVQDDTDASLQGLATIHSDQWIDLAYTHGVAPGNSMEPEHYAIQLANDVEARMPTASLVNKINRGEIFFNQPGIDNVYSLLKTKPEFDIVNDNITEFSKKNQLDDNNKELLQNLQNLKKLGTRWEDAEAFLNKDITSVSRIVEYSPEQLKIILEKEVEPENIATVYSNAIAAQNLGVALVGYLQPALYGINSFVMLDSKPKEDALSGNPTLRSLFGSLEQCACDPCLSVLSPAAYFADLLRYIDSSVDSNNFSAGEVLEKIRPDLYDLEISCNNSQIELPYIDLSLEILENKVAFPCTLALPAGINVFNELKDQHIVGMNIKQRLKETSEEPLGDIMAEKASKDNSTWVLTDSNRRWALTINEDVFRTDKSQKTTKGNLFNITNIKVDQLLRWLNSVQPSSINVPDFKAAFEEQILKRHIKSEQPFSMADYSIVKMPDVDNGFHWRIDYSLKNNVSILKASAGTDKVNMTIDDGNGSRSVSKVVNVKTGEATEKQLKAGEMSSLIMFKQKPAHLKIVKDDDKYKITASYSLHLYYSPANMLINSLTYQSTKAGLDLFAQPQNRNLLAYSELAGTTSQYPWSLPYNQPLAETRLLLEKAGSSRLNLIDANNDYEDQFATAEWAREQLGLSLSQQTVITTSKIDDTLYAAWGIKRKDEKYVIFDSLKGQDVFNVSGLELLRMVSIVMQQARIDFNELQELLQSQFINKDRLTISYNEHCDPTQMLIQKADNQLFDKMHRFTRIWRALGWSISQVDDCLMSAKIGNQVLNEDAIVHLAQINILHRHSGLPLDTIIALFNPFTKKIAGSTVTQPAPIYEQLFQNKTIHNPVDPDLNQLAIVDKEWMSVMPALAASFGILQPALESFLRSGISEFTSIDLTAKVKLEDLLSIWQHLTMAGSLQLSLADYAAACKLIFPLASPSPFANPDNLLNFTSDIKFVKQVGIKLADLEKILSAKNEEDILPVETAFDIFSDLQKELRAITKLDYAKFNVQKLHLAEPWFNLPGTESARWTYWLLTEIAGSQEWSVGNPADPTIQIKDLPLLLLQRVDILMQQIAKLFPGLVFSQNDFYTLLRTSFVSTTGPNALLTGSNITIITNLAPVHLDRIIRFLKIKQLTDLSIVDLDEMLKTDAATGNEPLTYDLNRLIDIAASTIKKQHDVIVTYISQIYKLDLNYTKDLLSNFFTVYLTPTKIPSALSFLSLFEFWNENKKLDKNSILHSNEYSILIKITKLCRLNQYWKATQSQINWLFRWNTSNVKWFTGIVPDNLFTSAGRIPYLDWKQSTLLFQTAQINIDLENTLYNYVKALSEGDANTKVSGARMVLADAFGLQLQDVDAGAFKQGMNDIKPSSSNQTLINTNFDPIRLCRLINYLSQLQKLGLNASQFETLIAEPLKLPFESVRIARQILFARYGASNYAEGLKEVNNQLRVEDRNRLVDYLVWKEGVPDANGLYEKYLIDVEMSPCMRTTRLLQSTAAAQLFVHRCLLNLQQNPLVLAESFDKVRWEWTKNYRVWEANRKVFLYPENWLYPELRDDKTEPFKEMESKLQMGDLVTTSTKEIINSYLKKVSQHSNIIVKGMFEFESKEKNMTKNNLLVVGRLPNQPLKYYWRVCSGWPESDLMWTSWKEIKSDISSVYVIPYAVDGEPFLAWPVIKQDENNQNWKVLFKWTSLKDEKESEWNSKELFAPRVSGKDIETSFAFRANIMQDSSSNFLKLNAITQKSIQISCFCIVAAPTVNYGTRTKTLPILINGVTTQKLPENSISAQAWVEIKTKLFTKYSDGTNPIIDSPVKLEVLSWTNKYLRANDEILLTNSRIAIAFTDMEGLSIIKIRLDDLIDQMYLSYVLTGSISWKLRVTANELPKSSSDPLPESFDFVIDSGVIDQANTRLIDELKPSSYILNYMCQFIRDKEPERMPAKIYQKTDRLPLRKFGEIQILDFGQDCITNQLPINERSIGLSNPSTGYQLEGNNAQDNGKFSFGRDLYAEGLRFVTTIPENLADKQYLVTATLGNEPYYIRNGALPANQTSFHYSDSSLRCYIGVVKKMPEYKSERLFILESNSVANDKSILENNNNLVEIQKSNDIDVTGRTKYGQLFLNYKFNSLRINEQSITTRQINFKHNSPEAVYNWEIFFHLSMRLAREYFNQHRYQEARKWFHFIFDPTTNDATVGKERFWRFLPFRKNNQPDSVNKLIDVLLNPNRVADKECIQKQIIAWLADPFNPFAIARLRINAYEWFTIMAYIKNLIEWGDQLFRRDTRESINEATLLYVTASDILGRRPIQIRRNAALPQSLSYRTLAPRLGKNEFSNAWVTLLDTPLGKQLLEQIPNGFGGKLANFFQTLQLSSIGSSDFCVPTNEKLPELWDTVADRLYKIRNCKNFDGVSRDLPLLDPPIDPELLIRAKAAGVSISDALGDMYAPPPLYRFNIVVQKAIDLCSEVKALGAAILSAIEKKEAEHLSLLRSGQEIEMQKLVAAVRQEQISEASANINALKISKANIIQRVIYLQQQMGETKIEMDDNGVPKLSQSYINKPVSDFDWTITDLGGLGLTKSEVDQIVFMQTNNIFNLIAGVLHTASGISHGVAAAYPLAAPFATPTGQSLSATGTFANTLASHYAMLEKRAGTMAGWQRRRDEWLHQAKTSILEINQIDKQIVASEIRKVIAEKELDNHYKQIEHSRTLDDYVRHQKFTRETLYTWMESQLSIIYKSAYNMAFEQAKKVEKAFRFELGDENAFFITPGYWDSFYRGLLAGEGLMQDLKRMEVAYMDRSKRDFEITKHISLTQLDPLALLQLRATGTCNFDIPEVLFDMDFPGHYFRRIKSVSLSIPCIAGPYTSISATLSLTSNMLRRKPSDADVSKGYNTNQSSIATSHAQNDSGMFELNFRDERYLPFEGCGAISSWRLELPAAVRQFDYNTISDIVIHLKYTARNDSALATTVKNSVVAKLNAIKQQFSETGLHLPISLKHDMPNEWNLLARAGTTPITTVPITIDKSRLPYMAQAGAKVDNITFFVRTGQALTNPTIIVTPTGVSADKEYKDFNCSLTNYMNSKYYKGIKTNFDGKASSIDTSIPFYFNLSINSVDITKLDDLVMVVKYRLT